MEKRSFRSRTRPLRLPLFGVLGVLGALGVLAAACDPGDQRTGTIDLEGPSTRAQLPEEMVAQLDSGSAAFREEDFEAARMHYERATEMQPDQPSGWFGLYMAHRAMGDMDAAEEALSEVRALVPGASIVHPRDEDTIR